MELEEDKISFATIKQYVLLLKNNLDELNVLEFKTLKGWLVYSLSLVVTFCVPCVIFLLITGLLSGDISVGLLWAVSLIPVMFVLPLTLLLTFINNYRKPKILRKLILQVLNRYDWDGPVRQTGRTQFECVKDNFLFRTEVRQDRNLKGRKKWIAYIFIPYCVPVQEGNEEEYIKNVEYYLKGKSRFLIQVDMAYFGASVEIFPKFDLHTDIEQLLYVMRRFHLYPGTFYNPFEIICKVPNTLEILVLNIFGLDVDQRWLKWAEKMLAVDLASENMRRLVDQKVFPDNQQELKELMRIIIREFNLDIFSKDQALRNYVQFFLVQAEDKVISVVEIICFLNDLYIASGVSALGNFSLLYKAKLALDETGTQSFWTEDVLSVDTIDTYLLSYLHTWLKKGQLGQLELE